MYTPQGRGNSNVHCQHQIWYRDVLAISKIQGNSPSKCADAWYGDLIWGGGNCMLARKHFWGCYIFTATPIKYVPLTTSINCTVWQWSLDPFHLASYYVKWMRTLWTYSKRRFSHNLCFPPLATTASPCMTFCGLSHDIFYFILYFYLHHNGLFIVVIWG